MIEELILIGILLGVFLIDYFKKRRKINSNELVILKTRDNQTLKEINLTTFCALILSGILFNLGFVKLIHYQSYGKWFTFYEIYNWSNKDELYLYFIIGFFLFCSIGLVCILYQTSLKRFTLNIKGFIATRTSKILLFLINQKKKVVVFLISIPTLKLIIHYFIYPIKKSVVIGREKVEPMLKGIGSTYKNIYGESVRKGVDVHIEVLFKEELILFIPSILIALLGFWLFNNKKIR